jgi:hypothetical protein
LIRSILRKGKVEMKRGFLSSFYKMLKEQSDDRFGLAVKRASIAFLFALISTGVVLRFLRIGQKSLWIDEVYMLITVKRTLLDGILQLQDYSAPLYQLILRLVIHATCPSEVFMRLPAALFGCLSIAAAWWFARTLFGSRVALFAASVIALNPRMLHYSREARPYSLFTLTSTLSMTFFYRLMRGSGRMNIIGYVLFTILMVYSHYCGFLVFAAQLFYLILDRFATRAQDRRSTPCAIMVAVFFMSIPSAWLALRYVISGAQGIMGGWLPSYGPINCIRLFGELVFEKPFMGSLFLIPLIATVWTGANAFDSSYTSSCTSCPITEATFWQRRAPAILCAFWITLSIYPLIAAKYLYRPVFHPRYALPIVVPLVSMAIAFIRPFGRGIIVLSMVAFLAISAPNIYAELKPGIGLRELAGWLNQNARTEENVYTFDTGDKNPGKMGLQFYGFKTREFKELPITFDLCSASVNIQIDPLPRNKCSYFVSLAFNEQIEVFLNSIHRKYQLRPYGDFATLFIIDPIE